MRSPRKPPRLDRMDAELIEETIQSPGWQLIQQGMRKMLDRKKNDLVRPQTEMETASARGAIAALETALQIPEILMQEAKNANV